MSEPPVVLHILPQFGIGGAELAARTAAMGNPNVHIHFLKRKPDHLDWDDPRVTFGDSASCLGPGAVMSAIASVRRIRPDVVTFSLWRTMAAYLAIRLIFPRKAIVSILHSDRAVHVVDRLWTGFSAATADAVWADSDSSLSRVPRGRTRTSRRKLSFVVHRLAAERKAAPAPRFVCWARLTDAKNFPLALQLIDGLRTRFPDITFDIIGPDGGAASEIKAKIQALDLGERVTLHPAANMDRIAELARDKSFFLQLSKYEGMAMSVVEAMQLGLVPIVTPVGEPAVYCHDMENAVVFAGIEQASEEIAQIIADPVRYAKMSAAAIATWADAPIYADDFVAAAEDLWRTGKGRRNR